MRSSKPFAVTFFLAPVSATLNVHLDVEERAVYVAYGFSALALLSLSIELIGTLFFIVKELLCRQGPEVDRERAAPVRVGA